MRKKKQENKISSVKLASERLHSSVLFFLSYSLVSLLSFFFFFYDWGRFSLSKGQNKNGKHQHTEASIVFCPFIIKKDKFLKTPFKLFEFILWRKTRNNITRFNFAITLQKNFYLVLPKYSLLVFFPFVVFDLLPKTAEVTPFSICLFITNVTKIRDANIERPRLKEPVIPSQIQREMAWWRGRNLERGEGEEGVLDPFGLFSRGRTVQIFTAGWWLARMG